MDKMVSDPQITLSIVSPVYNSHESVELLVNEINASVAPMQKNFEIVLVEDGSSDSSWEEIQKQCAKHSHVIGVKLSRNFGQHSAITACLQYARGQYIVLLDCDLQDNPKYIPELYKKCLEGFDVVYARKDKRAQPFLKKKLSQLFFLVFNNLTAPDIEDSSHFITAYSMMTKKVRDAYLQITDQHRHYLMILKWLGYSKSYINIKDQPRRFGKSSYNLSKLINHALIGIIYQTDTLLFWALKVAASLFVVTIFATIYIIFNYFIKDIQPGWTSLIVMILFGISINLFFIGIIGIYVGKGFEESKKRPIFLVDKALNSN